MTADYRSSATGWSLVRSGRVHKPPHKCPVPSARYDQDYGEGAVVRCDECGQLWRARYNPFSESRWVWSPNRWWHALMYGRAPTKATGEQS